MQPESQIPITKLEGFKGSPEGMGTESSKQSKEEPKRDRR